jgi:hypothetical protein
MAGFVTLGWDWLCRGRSGSSENMKRIALALDTGCITRLGGCTNIAELSPKVWRQTSPRIISCRITTHEGVIDNASE